VQSALAPGGEPAAGIAQLTWWLWGGAAIIWIAVIGLALWCVRVGDGRSSRRRDRALIIGGGVIVPIVVLTILLAYGLMMIPPLVARAPADALQVAVTGERWWWRVRYLREGDEPVDLANVIRLPVNAPVQFLRDSDNVIHSFWIPSLGGKMDMIPGRVTWLALRPSRTGVFRGACAEYCGGSHALMSFDVEVVSPEAFDAWLEHQSAPAAPPIEPLAIEGSRVFHAVGCGACHTIRGTSAGGRVGPDLTHVGSRPTLAASVLPNDPEAFRRWVAHPAAIKPQALMPRFDMLPLEDLRALAAYLESLQ
jgi:cytochrome c oxidase subunit 2